MKKIHLLSVATAVCATIFLFTQCTNDNSNAQVAQPAVSAPVANGGLKIAYVDIDSLFNNYKLSLTMNKEMLRKDEDIRMKLNEKARAIQADIEDFQNKLANNVYATRQRAEEEQARIMKRQEDYKVYEQRLVNELATETQKNNVVLRDSINSFLKDFNAQRNYDLIISRVGDNLLYANDALDITQEVIEGLNKRYNAEED